MLNPVLNQLKIKWKANCEDYKVHEVGGGIHNFISDMFLCENLFGLKMSLKKNEFGTFTHDTVLGKEGRPDFILYIEKEVTIPVEAKCFGQIKEGITQLQRYQIDYSKQYGILTDGNEWRFYRAGQYHRYFLEEILEKTDEFLVFWNDYIKPEYYYIEIFNPTERQNLFEEKIDLNDAENRKIFFDDTTKLISNFRLKLKTDETEKKQVETAYSYLIQFILYKVLVDSGFQTFINEYQTLLRKIKKIIIDRDFYSMIVKDIREIADYISKNIYKPFAEEQVSINQKLEKNLKKDLTINDISAWLDILIFIDKYSFANLKNEIFGFVYENYLKDLYEDKNKGQYFTDPEVVNLMLEELGYTPENLKNQRDKISIIDPACGAGTFLYSAVDAVLKTFPEKLTEKEAQKVEQLISKNVFGLDIEEFPLYLAEMSILMRLLPLIVNDDYNNPIDEKIKVFKTKDSISEFLDAGIGAINPDIDYPTLFSKTDLGYQSFMRDNKNLQEMIESMQGHNGERMRFDFVVGNPPYIGYNDCSRQHVPFIGKFKDKTDDSIKFNDVYGVNMHSVPNKHKKYAPKPNLWAFFIALSLALLKKGGKMCYIIPQTLLTETDYDVLRYHLAKFSTIEKIITFGGKMFIGRGLKGKKPVATSSLILIIKKTEPTINTKTKIIQYKKYTKLPSVDMFKKYLNAKKNRREKYILQKELYENFDNWNFITQEKDVVNFLKSYKKNSVDLSVYYNHKLAKEHFGDIFYFDAGFSLEKDKYSTEKLENAYKLVFIENNNYLLKTHNYYPKTDKIDVPQGSQGLKCLEKKYKIIWRKTFAGKTKFNFCDLSDVILDTGLQFISSDNKTEILFLLALLNSNTNTFLLNKLLKLEHEQKGIFIVIKRLKNFIRVPKITSENQAVKDKIIELTEKMLDLENVVLKDLVDFNGLMVQRFNNIQVIGNELVLTFNNKNYYQKIEKNKIKFVEKLISEKFYDNGLIFNREEVTLQELKDLEAIDFEQQEKLKTEIDTLVEKLYFD